MLPKLLFGLFRAWFRFLSKSFMLALFSSAIDRLLKVMRLETFVLVSFPALAAVTKDHHRPLWLSKWLSLNTPPQREATRFSSSKVAGTRLSIHENLRDGHYPV